MIKEFENQELYAQWDKQLKKRVKRIVALVIEDFYGYGYSTNETPRELNKWLVEELLKDAGIEDAPTYGIALKIYQMLQIVKEIDLQEIHEIVFNDMKKRGENK